MGMSLPFLVRAMVAEARTGAAGRSACSTASTCSARPRARSLTPWVLIRFFGIRGAVLVAAAANASRALLGAGALAASRAARGRGGAEAAAAAPPTPAPRRRQSLRASGSPSTR